MLHRSRMPSQIAKELEVLIREGMWTPGERLPSERSLAERFRVSRATMREALRLLEASGLLEIRPGSGAMIRAPASAAGHLLAQRLDGLNLRDLFEFRFIVEPEAAALAARRAVPDLLQELERVLRAQERSLEDPHGFLTEDMEFHQLIAMTSGNAVLQEVIRVLNAGLRQTRLRAMARVYDPVRTLEGHRRIFQALLDGHEEEAREAMRWHLSEVEMSAFGFGVSQGGEGQ